MCLFTITSIHSTLSTGLSEDILSFLNTGVIIINSTRFSPSCHLTIVHPGKRPLSSVPGAFLYVSYVDSIELFIA